MATEAAGTDGHNRAERARNPEEGTSREDEASRRKRTDRLAAETTEKIGTVSSRHEKDGHAVPTNTYIPLLHLYTRSAELRKQTRSLHNANHEKVLHVEYALL